MRAAQTAPQRALRAKTPGNTGPHAHPNPLQDARAEILRQRFKLAHIIRVGCKQHLVVPHAGRNKGIFLRALAALELPVNKQALHPSVANVARVAGVIHPRPEIRFHRSVAGRKEAHLLLCKMRGLLHADYVVFLPLILVYIVCAVAIAKAQARAVREAEHAFRGVVLRNPRKLLQKRHNMVFPELRQRAPEKQRIELRRCESKQYEFSAHCPAFSPAARSAVCRVPHRRAKEFRLPWVRRPF